MTSALILWCITCDEPASTEDIEEFTILGLARITVDPNTMHDNHVYELRRIEIEEAE